MTKTKTKAKASNKTTIDATVTVSTERTLVAVGCHTRWDVGTKARVVKQILETDYPADATYKERYEIIAKQYNVTYQTIHNWVKDYGDICTTAQYALDGTLILSPTVIQGETNISNTLIGLRKIRAKVNKLLEGVETAPYIVGKSAKEAKRGKTSVQQQAADISIKSDE